MDEIRIQHEDESTSAQVCFVILSNLGPHFTHIQPKERTALNTVVHDIELAVDFGRNLESNEGHKPEDEEIPSIEHFLKRVASEASHKGDLGGIMNQVREFNAFLERAALALETKRN